MGFIILYFRFNIIKAVGKMPTTYKTSKIIIVGINLNSNTKINKKSHDAKNSK